VQVGYRQRATPTTTMRALLRVGCGRSARGRHLCTSSGAALAHARLREQLASVKQQLRSLETAHPELRESRDGLEDELKTLVAANPDLRSERHASDAFAPPKLHHINVVSREVTGLLEFSSLPFAHIPVGRSNPVR